MGKKAISLKAKFFIVTTIVIVVQFLRSLEKAQSSLKREERRKSREEGRTPMGV